MENMKADCSRLMLNFRNGSISRSKTISAGSKTDFVSCFRQAVGLIYRASRC
jgi:hypothetical protein